MNKDTPSLPLPFTESAAKILEDPPTLTKVFKFETSSGSTINIAQEIGRHYSTLGPLLLNDDTGAETLAIVSQQQRDVELINNEILKRWLHGQGKRPVSWFTLIGVLKDVGLLDLAQKIEGDLIKAKVQEHKTENTKLRLQLETQEQQLDKTEKRAKLLQQRIGQKVLHRWT